MTSVGMPVYSQGCPIMLLASIKLFIHSLASMSGITQGLHSISLSALLYRRTVVIKVLIMNHNRGIEIEVCDYLHTYVYRDIYSHYRDEDSWFLY